MLGKWGVVCEGGKEDRTFSVWGRKGLMEKVWVAPESGWLLRGRGGRGLRNFSGELGYGPLPDICDWLFFGDM